MEVKHFKESFCFGTNGKSYGDMGIKESFPKSKTKRNQFSEHILKMNFVYPMGKCSSELHFNNTIEKFKSTFYKVEDYIFVCAFPNNYM